ncbi:MAG: aryl-sulfate sulfotransferase [Myxococcales bacterium]|nr:aryl-sulfate sulfotransferase [Myxococcales bacterium]
MFATRSNRSRGFAICGRAAVIVALLAATHTLGCEEQPEDEHAIAGAEEIDPELADQLMAIGYLRGSRVIGKSGVTLHDRNRAHQGYNLFSSGHAPEAILMDMDGGILHRWRFPYEAAFGRLDINENAAWWRRVAIFENGDLLAIFEGLGLIKIDKDSKLIWSNPLNAHHDLEVQSNGDIYVLTRKARIIPRIDSEAPILEDFISILSSDGKLKIEMSLLQAFETSRFADLVQRELVSGNGDIFHTNTLAVLSSDRSEDRRRGFTKGNVLLSMNRMGVVALLDIRLGQIIWVRRTPPIGQHDPKLLPNGNMLLFTNNMNTRSSVVEEFDPVSGEVHWSYRGNVDHPFYSMYLGAAERLTNGNTLITESDGGRALEVTPSGETVWEFYNPNRTGSDEAFIATLPEMIRLSESYPVGWALFREPLAR